MRYWIIVGLMTISAATAGGENWRLGGGAHYWRTIDEIEDDSEFDEDGLAYLASVQWQGARFLKLEGTLEFFPDGFAGATNNAIAPQAFVVVGSVIHADLGVGTVYSSDFDDDFTEPFYVLRAGLDLELLPRFYLDLLASYHFVDWDRIDEADDDVDTDTVTLGAVIRLEL